MTPGAAERRVEHVDWLRGLAVVGMFFVHSAPAWLAEAHRGGVYAVAASQIAGMVAPVFMLLAGVSVAIVAGRDRDPEAAARRRRRTALRGLQILAGGYALHFAFFALRGFHGAQRVLKVDILHCIGLSMALLSIAAWPRRRFNWPALAAFAALIVGAQVAWRLPLTDWMPHGLAAYFTYYSDVSLFPLLPYGAWVALGMFVGPLWRDARRSAASERRFWIGIAAAAAACYAAYLGLEAVEQRSGLRAWLSPEGTRVRTTVSFFFFKITLAFALLASARLVEGPLRRLPRRPLLLLGRVSLFAYCLHLILIYHLFSPLGLDGCGPAGHLAGFAALTIVMVGLSWLWIRRGRWSAWRRLRERLTARGAG
mgnify:CR=1 FL=1